MQRGDHVLVELVDLATESDVVGYFSFDWPDELQRSACIPVPLQLDHSFPLGDYGLFVEGDYGANVRVGPVDELGVSTSARATGMRVVDLLGSPADPGGTVTQPPGSSSSDASRRDVQRASRKDVEETLTRRAEHLGFYGCKRFRESGANDPFAYGATGAIRCVNPVSNVTQFAFFRFPDGASMRRYWTYRLGEIEGRLPRNNQACRNGKKGLTSWARGQRFGSVACFISTSQGGTKAARVRWIDEGTNTYGIVDAKDARIGPLAAWWETNLR